MKELTTTILDYKGREKKLTIKLIGARWYVIEENRTLTWGTLNECLNWIENWTCEMKKEFGEAQLIEKIEEVKERITEANMDYEEYLTLHEELAKLKEELRKTRGK